MEGNPTDAASITSKSGTTDSVDERLRLASLNAVFNSEPQSNLRPDHDDDRALIKSPPITPVPSRPSTDRDPTAAVFHLSSTDDEMDRKLRQNKPRLLLMGQRRSGKSSITSVVFHKMPPQETLFLESTTQIQKDSMRSFMDFQVWDFPGQLDYFDPTFDTTEIFSEIGALVWVIDAQDDYTDSLNRLTTTILNLQTTFPHINVEVFIHKIDSLNEEFRSDIYQDIVQRVGDELSDAGYINPNVSYHLTSIYDYSIFEAFSKVIQKLIPQLDTLENLLNILVNNCGMAKAYLFDIWSKIYVASDTRPIDMEVYEMCSDYIDVIVDITDIYGYDRRHEKVLGEQMQEAESSVTIHDGTMIYLKEMNQYLCLVTVIKNDEAKDKKGLIDYNCHIFQDALNAVFARAWEKDKSNEQGGEQEQKPSKTTAQG
ncbi:GTP-binding protein gtr2 [Exophiala dermatitidis]|nr:GTP-binding protein gtr2 [Exophiala dermatitidis]KAJ4524545.1 GTP-binding protein gtr2 [Exophiala dermatitidis]KAJ4527399.1 GTP-binding protein gtr2 [Exophiala dermatitidis]KAJ4549855.1 GTP-binding protein gtr2 [Exophiala dermatitidis]KAJ4585034.1 GTP-binding protein gtr2 [Exophiala dermatitidis]